MSVFVEKLLSPRQWAQTFPLWPMTALSVALDVGLRPSFRTNMQRTLWWIGSVVFSLVFWKLAHEVSVRVHLHRPRVAKFGLIVVTTLAALLTVISIGFHREFHTWPTTFALVHSLSERSEAAGYVGQKLIGPWGGLIVALAFLMHWHWRRAMLQVPPARPRTLKLTLLAVGLGVIAYGAVGRFASFMVPDASTAKIWIDVAVNKVIGGFHGRLMDADRAKLPKITKAPDGSRQPNVVLVIGESLAARRMSLYGYHRPTTPELSRWRDEAPEGFVTFRRAVSNATVTKVAYPTFVSGLFPVRSPLEFHEFPLVWHYAAAANYRTALVSAQSYAWNNFEGFFIDKTLDHVFNVETSKNPIVNSTGMDDALMMDDAVRFVAEQTQDVPFFLTIQFNGTHYPGFSHPGHRSWQDPADENGRYDNAVHCMDLELGRLRKALSEKGFIDNTLVVMSSDHGEGRSHDMHRTESYWQEFLEIPLIVIVPPALQERLGSRLETLKANAVQRVCLADIVPTILDAAGLRQTPSLSRWVGTLDGQSLFDPVSDERTILAVNTDENFKWSRQGFAVVRGDWKFMYYDWVGQMLFDLARDPSESHNLLEAGRDRDERTRREHEHALSIVEHQPVLKQIMSGGR